MSASEDAQDLVDTVKHLEDDLDEMTKGRDELEATRRPPLDADLVSRIEEHVIKLQDDDVKNSTRIHETTIALLRECKA